MKNGIELISEERKRQIEKEGYTQEHDNNHNTEEFVLAAIAYLECNFEGYEADLTWPWDSNSFKPKDVKTNLVKAGALIAAALDRIQNEQG